MIIKKYIQFLKEAISGYKYGCVMIKVPFSNWEEITSCIDPNDIYEIKGDSTYGIQKNPHLTLLYPVLSNVKFEKVKEVLDKVIYKNIIIKIDKIDVFENEEFDVLKFNVDNNEYLNKIHNELKNNIPNEYKYDIYRPHITIAYLKKGKGKKYKRKYNHSLVANKITYSNNDIEETFII
jgi:2'-5' RNA ligase